MVYTIYKLTNPKTSEVFYVGSTRNIVLRGGGHCNKGHRNAYGLAPKDKYIIEQDISPLMEVIRIVEGDMSKLHGGTPINVLLIEKHWIEHFFLNGMPMQNKNWFIPNRDIVKMIKTEQDYSIY